MVQDINITQAAKDGWIAGIIDGEGCLYAKLQSKGKTSIFCRFTLRTTSKNMMDAFSEQMSLKDIKYSVRFIEQVQKEHHRPSYMLDINNKASILKFLRLYSPYIVNKLPEALIMLSYLEKAIKSKYYHPDQEDIEMIDKLKSLKKLA